MRNYRVTLHVFNREDLLRGVQLPPGLAVRAAQFTSQVADPRAPARVQEFVELVCVEQVDDARVLLRGTLDAQHWVEALSNDQLLDIAGRSPQDDGKRGYWISRTRDTLRKLVS